METLPHLTYDFGTAGVDLVVQLRRNLGPTTGQRQIVDDRSKIEPGAAHQKSPMVVVAYVTQGRSSGSLELRHGELVADLYQIDEMVRYFISNRHGGFGRSNIHAPVDTHGVDRDDLDIAHGTGYRPAPSRTYPML